MNCPEARERLSDYALDEALESDRDVVAGHLASCAGCARELDELQAAIELVRGTDWGAEAAPLSPERREALDEASRWSRRLNRGWRVVGWSAAALTVLLFGWPLFVGRHLGHERALPTYGLRIPPTTTLAPSLSREPHYVDVPPEPTREMFFDHPGTNPFVETRRDPLSTFGLDVDTASYTLTRNYLKHGALPPPEAVRVEEFVNAFRYDDPAPAEEAFAIHVEAAPSPFRSGYHLLRIALKAREVEGRARKPAVLTFVIDVSGSMATANRLGLVQRSLRRLVERLGEADRIGIVVYGAAGRVVLEPTPASEAQSILAAIDSLHPEGSTNLEEGLDLGYGMARQAFDPAASNRVVLCTDGVANNGVTDARTLVERIHQQAADGIVMTALGFGMGHYNDALLQKLADQGDGQYAYIDDDREAQAFFMRDLTGLLELVARDAKAQVEFSPDRVAQYRLLGYEKRELADQAFRDDSVDGGEINSGHTVTVLYELKLAGAGPLGTVRVRYQEPESRRPVELSRSIEEGDLRARFADASARLRLAAVVVRFAEHLRHSRWAEGSRIDEVLQLAETLPAPTRQDPQVIELVELLRAANGLSSAPATPPSRRW